MYRIMAQIETRDGDWTGSRQVPTFYLSEIDQGIVSESHARKVAIEIIDPGGFAQRSGKLTSIHVMAEKIER